MFRFIGVFSLGHFSSLTFLRGIYLPTDLTSGVPLFALLKSEVSTLTYELFSFPFLSTTCLKDGGRRGSNVYNSTANAGYI